MEMVTGSRSRPYYSRRCKKVRTSPTDIESLPDDLLSEILVRVPADDLHDGAKLVCRRWSHIISSVAFLNAHLHHSSYGLVLCVRGSTRPIHVSATKQGQIEVSSLSCQYIISSCNGLVLEYPSPGIPSLSILNPAAKKAILLPQLFSKPSDRYRFTFTSAALGATSTQYKVVQIHMDRLRLDTPHLAILTVGVDNSWRQLPVEHIPHNLRPLFDSVRSRVVNERFIYWSLMTSRNILSLDLETEVIAETSLPLPACASVEKLFYLSTGRHLSVLFSRRASTWEVWEMKPGAGGYLRKCRHFEFSSKQIDDRKLFWWPCGWVNYPEVLACRIGIEFPGTVIFYNLRTHEIDSTEVNAYIPIPRLQPFPHRKSLQWLS